MTLNDIDTSEFHADPKKEDFLTKLERYPEFKWPTELTNVKTGLKFTYDKQQICTYIVLLYDRKSSLIKDFGFYPLRKHQAAVLTGWAIDPNTDKFPVDINAIILGDVPVVNAAIVKYCLAQNSVEHLALMSYLSMFTSASMAALSGEYTKDIYALINNLKTSIAASEAKLFGGEEVRSMEEALYQQMEIASLGVKPEDVAEKLAAGEAIFPEANPYGEEYKVETMHYMGDK